MTLKRVVKNVNEKIKLNNIDRLFFKSSWKKQKVKTYNPLLPFLGKIAYNFVTSSKERTRNKEFGKREEDTHQVYPSRR
jgi:hypothetical protein